MPEIVEVYGDFIVKLQHPEGTDPDRVQLREARFGYESSVIVGGSAILIDLEFRTAQEEADANFDYVILEGGEQVFRAWTDKGRRHYSGGTKLDSSFAGVTLYQF